VNILFRGQSSVTATQNPSFAPALPLTYPCHCHRLLFVKWRSEKGQPRVGAARKGIIEQDRPHQWQKACSSLGGFFHSMLLKKKLISVKFFEILKQKILKLFLWGILYQLSMGHKGEGNNFLKH